MLSATHGHGLCMSSDFDQVYVILSSVACDNAHISVLHGLLYTYTMYVYVNTADTTC